MGAGGSKPEASAGSKHIFARYVESSGYAMNSMMYRQLGRLRCRQFLFVNFQAGFSMAGIGSMLVESTMSY